MFWNAKVTISVQTYRHYWHFMWFFRLLGFFPITVLKKKSRLFLKFSPLLAACGFLYGTFTIYMGYWGIYQDVGINKEDSIRVTTDMDKFMYINDVTGYGAIFFCGVILNPCKFLQFFKFVRCLNQADSLMKMSHKKSDTCNLILVLLGVITVNAVLFSTDISDSYKILGDKLGLIGVLQRYLGLDTLALMSNLIEYTNRILLKSLEKRLKRLNELLKIEYVKLKWKSNGVVKEAWVTFKKSLDFDDEPAIPADTLTKLSKAYLAIMDASDVLNDFLGPITLATIMAVFWALIESPYFFILAISGQRGEVRDVVEVPEAALVLIFHLLRVLLITESSYACLVQIETTKSLICKQLSLKLCPSYRKQLQSFTILLALRKLEFSACGLFTVNRILFTSLLDTITKLLVILLQYRDEIHINL